MSKVNQTSGDSLPSVDELLKVCYVQVAFTFIVTNNPISYHWYSSQGVKQQINIFHD